MKPIRVNFIYKADPLFWRDGLWKALGYLQYMKEIELFEYNRHERLIPWWDLKFLRHSNTFTLVWGACSSPWVSEALEIPTPKGVCLAGTEVDLELLSGYDIIFYETPWHRTQLAGLKWRHRRRLAFGTNGTLFTKMEGVEKRFDWLYPAAFAAWKRHEEFLQMKGKKIAVGHMQPFGVDKDCIDICLADQDTIVMPQVRPEVLVWLYNQAGNVYTTPEIMGGGERAILEGLACGVKPYVYKKRNPKLASLLEWVEELGFVPDHKYYAQQLIEGIRTVMPKSKK